MSVPESTPMVSTSPSSGDSSGSGSAGARKLDPLERATAGTAGAPGQTNRERGAYQGDTKKLLPKLKCMRQSENSFISVWRANSKFMGARK